MGKPDRAKSIKMGLDLMATAPAFDTPNELIAHIQELASVAEAIQEDYQESYDNLQEHDNLLQRWLETNEGPKDAWDEATSELINFVVMEDAPELEEDDDAASYWAKVETWLSDRQQEAYQHFTDAADQME